MKPHQSRTKTPLFPGCAVVCGEAAPKRHQSRTKAAPDKQEILTTALAVVSRTSVPSKLPPPSNNPPPWQSRLEPYSVEIFKWRRGDKSYRSIAALLKSEKSIEVSQSTVSRFVNARRNRAKAKQALLADLATAVPLPPSVAPERPSEAVSVPAKAPFVGSSDSVKPFVSMTPQSTGRGLPLSRNEEIVGTDASGRNITRNRPFKGKV